MGNLSNPIRIYENNLTLVGEMDDYQNAYFSRALYKAGAFSIQTNWNTAHATDLEIGRIVMFAKDEYRCGLITQIDKKSDQNGKGGQIITASGFEVPFIFSWRIMVPTTGSAEYSNTDKAETVIKDMIFDQCGAGADVKKRFPGLTIATDFARGQTYTLNARFNTTVLDELNRIALATDLGFYIRIDEATKTFVFDVIEGVDRTAGQSVNPRAIFSNDFDTLKDGNFIQSDNQYRNFAYVAGQGVGEARNIRPIYSTDDLLEPSGFDRREVYIDARDLEANADLDRRGAQKLGELSIQTTLSGSPLTYSPLVYRTDYDLGDLVTIKVYDQSYTARITEVKESWSPLTYNIDVVFDKEMMDLSSQINSAVGNIKNNLSRTEGIMDQEILTSSDVTFASATIDGIIIPTVIDDASAYTGFTNNENITVTYDSTTRKVTLAGTFKAYYKGRVVMTSTGGTWVSPAHSAGATTPLFLYYDGTAFIWSTTQWTFDQVQIAFVAYTSAGTFLFALREVHGLMDWKSHEEFHQTVGTYRLSGLDLSSYTLASTTATARRPDTSTGIIKDEDLQTTVLTQVKGTAEYRIMSLSGAGATNVFSAASAEIALLSGNTPFWNQFTGGAWAQTLMSANTFMTMWQVAIPVSADTTSQGYRLLWIQGQSNGALAVEQGLTTASLNLSALTLLAPEIVFINKMILRFTAANWTIHQVDRISGTRFSQVSSPSGSFLSSVSTNTTLTGDGTAGIPLAVNPALTITTLTTSGGATIGTGAPSVKMKKFTGTTASTQGADLPLSHGLTASKILSWGVAVEFAGSSQKMPPNWTRDVGYEYFCYLGDTTFILTNKSGNSSNILSKPFTILITYEE